MVLLDRTKSSRTHRDAEQNARLSTSGNAADVGNQDAEGILLARIEWSETMDPVTSPLIHKDSGRRTLADPGEPNPFRKNDQTLGSVPLSYAR